MTEMAHFDSLRCAFASLCVAALAFTGCSPHLQTVGDDVPVLRGDTDGANPAPQQTPNASPNAAPTQPPQTTAVSPPPPVNSVPTTQPPPVVNTTASNGASIS